MNRIEQFRDLVHRVLYDRARADQLVYEDIGPHVLVRDAKFEPFVEGLIRDILVLAWQSGLGKPWHMALIRMSIPRVHSVEDASHVEGVVLILGTDDTLLHVSGVGVLARESQQEDVWLDLDGLARWMAHPDYPGVK